MADVSDPAITEAYQSVRKEGGQHDFLVLGYDGNTRIKVDAVGSGGIDALASNLNEDACQYGYARVTYQDDETKRTKFIFLSWAGEKSSILRRGKMSIHKANIKSVIKDFALEFHVTDRDEISEKAVVAKVRAANY